jgi:hypothetical protein
MRTTRRARAEYDLPKRAARRGSQTGQPDGQPDAGTRILYSLAAQEVKSIARDHVTRHVSCQT